MPKRWFTLKKAVEQQEEELSILFYPEMGEARLMAGCYHWGVNSNYFVTQSEQILNTFRKGKDALIYVQILTIGMYVKYLH